MQQGPLLIENQHLAEATAKRASTLLQQGEQRIHVNADHHQTDSGHAGWSRHRHGQPQDDVMRRSPAALAEMVIQLREIETIRWQPEGVLDRGVLRLIPQRANGTDR